MSQLDILEDHLQRYWQMPHHRDVTLSQKLTEVQAWQRKRMQNTHAELFAIPEHALIAAYFLTQLYGGEKFTTLARQLERILPKAKKIERLAPDTALQTGSMGISLAILAIELDVKLAQYLLDNQLELTDNSMMQAIQAIDDSNARREQMFELNQLCYRLDKYMRSILLQKAFALTKGQAYKHNFDPLYDFIAEGFAAMKPIKSMHAFIEPFCNEELAFVDAAHQAHKQN